MFCEMNYFQSNISLPNGSDDVSESCVGVD